MKTAHLTIQGLSPLLMHRFPTEPIEALQKKSKEERAEIALHRMPGTGTIYIPGMAFHRAMVNGAAYSKGKGRASLQKTVAGCVLVLDEYLILTPQTFIIDERAVVNPTTRGRIMEYRPRFDVWSVPVSAEFDENLVTEVQLRRVIDDTGKLVGLLDYRPERKGPFGRFMVKSWSVE